MERNLQYRRTDRDIINAFLTLAARKSFESLTVQDILEEALVSRYTFYKHFKDKYEIAERLQEEMLSDFVALKKRIQSEAADGVMSQQRQNQIWCRFAREHHDISLALANIHTETVDLNKKYQELFREEYLKGAAGQDKELEADICAGIQAALMEYFAAEPNMSIDKLGRPIQQALVNACLYLARLEPAEEVRKALSPFLE